MDFDFFNGFEHKGSVKLGQDLSVKVLNLKSFMAWNPFELKFPEGHQDAGNVMDAYSLEEKRYVFAKEISELISDECAKFLYYKNKHKIVKSDSPSNPQVLSSFIVMVLDDESSSFTVG